MSLDEPPRTEGLLSVRALVILMVAGVAALIAAVAAWFVVDQVVGGAGGRLVPVGAAVVSGGSMFWKAVDTLHRSVG